MLRVEKVEFMGLWEALQNPNFKRIDFDTLKKDVGTNAYVFSIKKRKHRRDIR